MAKAHFGVDFGTTNSSVAMAAGDTVRALELDPANDSPTSLPSLLYITSASESIVGRRAADAFIERNIDREVILKQIDLGIAIESQVFSEGDKEGGYRPNENPDWREATRARATVEVNSPGRLFQSLKSSLRHREFRGTAVFDQFYQLEELIAHILRPMKEAADRAAGECVESAVFGRPVHFSAIHTEDKLAEERLERAARLAGFKQVAFFYEPVAACVDYAIGSDSTQRLMVVDIGGGTCDVCIMEFAGRAYRAERLAKSRILGVAGVPVAGDAVDREVIQSKLYPCFGSKSRYGPANLPMPQYLYKAISDWQTLYKLNTEETVNWLIANEASSSDPKAICALRCLIQRNYGYPVTRIVEMTKKDLSRDLEAVLRIEKDDIQIAEPLTRHEFEAIVEHTLDDMFASIAEAERVAGVRSSEIDLVLTTGGTCLIPAVLRRLETRYGVERLRQRETFTSVATGLAVVSKFL